MPEVIYKYTNENVGFEGMTITDNFFYIGLENISDLTAQFSDSTYLYVVDRKTSDVKIISSKLFDAYSVTALCAVDDYTLYGIDRDSKKIFYIKFNSDFSIKETESKPIELSLPTHPDISIDLVAGAEAIAIDNDGNIYMDIDPWSDLYRPQFVAGTLTEEEKNNLTKLVPILYKFKNPFN
jgi:hypothetical protein